MCQISLWILQLVVMLSASLVVSATKSVKVNFQGSWRRGVGWELVCSWSFVGGDRLQSTRLFRAGRQFWIYRPAEHGARHNETFSEEMRVLCIEQEKHRGICVLTVTPSYPPASVERFLCEVSGERPHFHEDKKEYDLEAFVPAEDARIEALEETDNMSNRVVLNCTATGIPAPHLVWKVDNQIVPADFKDRFWNSTLMSEQAWSTLSVSPMSSTMLAVCTPEQVTYTRSVVVNQPAEYLISSASAIYGKYYAAVFLAIIKLLR